MKRLIFVLLVLMGMGVSAQVVDDGTRGRYPTRTETNSAFTTKVRGDSLKVSADSITLVLPTKADTSAVYNKTKTDYRLNLRLNKADTVTLSNRINLKLNTADTASLSNRINLKLNKVDTTTLSNRIDLKLNIDSAAIKYVNKLTDGFVLTDSFYTKTLVDSLDFILQRSRFDNTLKRLTGTTWISPIAAYTGITGTFTLTDGQRNYTLYEITDVITVSKFSWVLSVAGDYTADNYNGIALMSYNPTTKVYTKIIESADNGNIWKSSAETVQELSFTPQTLTPGFYAVCLIWNASATTTAPVIRTFGTYYQFSSGFYGHRLNATRATQVDIPATENYTDLSGGGTAVGIYLK